MAKQAPHTKTIVLIGNPNVGKTTVFNALTGLRQSTANYPGVTVEKKTGRLKLEAEEVEVIDLPGAYSLKAQSLDEEIVVKVLSGEQEGVSKPDLAVVIADANNFERNLYLTLQVLETGIPVHLVLNMWDQAEESGKVVSVEVLCRELGVTCTTAVASRTKGIKELKTAVSSALKNPQSGYIPINFNSLTIAERYKRIEEITAKTVVQKEKRGMAVSDRIDKAVTHPVLGWVIFVAIMSVIFQSIFTWANPFMDAIAWAVDVTGQAAGAVIPESHFQSLVVDGIIAGVGNVIVFLPQIFLLFLFIAFFEDFGYMARAAFVLDRVMKRVGLNGRAFLPLLSSFACAIPGIMATRTIQNRNDRLATILVAPLMSCSARLPVYTLLIGAFIPSQKIAGIFGLQGLVLLSMYLISIFAGLTMAAIFRKTFLKGDKTPFLMELPPYRIPRIGTVLLTMWERGKEFVVNAGSVIFWISIVLWFLVSFPNNSTVNEKYDLMKQTAQQTYSAELLEDELQRIDRFASAERLKTSYAGQLGTAIEPVIKPLGFDWKIGIGLIGSFAAREVLVSTLAIIYNVGEDADESSVDLIEALRNERNPDGTLLYSPLTALSLMVFFVLACQCMSTVAIVKRETNSWRWPIFMIVYMTVLAWTGSFIVYQGGGLLGL